MVNLTNNTTLVTIRRLQTDGLRQYLNVRLRSLAPAVRKHEVRKRRADPRPQTQVCRVARRVRLDCHPARRALDMVRRERVQRARNDAVCPKLRPQLVRAAKHARETLEHRVWLRLCAHKPPRELHDRAGVVLAEVVRVEHADRVERDVVPVRRGRVSIHGLDVVAARVHGFGEEGRRDVRLPFGDLLRERTPELVVRGTLWGAVFATV